MAHTSIGDCIDERNCDNMPLEAVHEASRDWIFGDCTFLVSIWGHAGVVLFIMNVICISSMSVSLKKIEKVLGVTCSSLKQALLQFWPYTESRYSTHVLTSSNVERYMFVVCLYWDLFQAVGKTILIWSSYNVNARQNEAVMQLYDKLQKDDAVPDAAYYDPKMYNHSVGQFCQKLS